MACVLSRTLAAFVSVISVATFAGCSAGDADEPDPASAGSTTVENCGMDVTVEKPPERVYAAYQPAIEIAHAIGISDRLVETAFLDSRVLPEYAAAQQRTKYVERLPSRDALLTMKPDFVLSGYNNVFADGSGDTSVGTRGSLAELGIRSWILSPLCPSEDGLSDEAIDPASVRVDSIYRDLRDLGRIFDVEERAEQVIADQKKRIAAVDKAVADAERPRVAIVLADDDGGFRVASGIDFGTQVVEHAGGVNVFDDLEERRHVEIDAEEIIRRDPDVILTSLCCDASYTTEDGKREVEALKEDPGLAGLSAVKNDRVHPFLFADRAAGVRAAHAIEQLAAILHPDLVDPSS